MATSTTASVLKPAVLIVYAAGLLQGLTLVSFPALSSVFTQNLGFSAAEYGAIFLPQVTFAVIGAAFSGWAARRLGLKTLLIQALAANVLSQLLLAAAAVAGDGAFVCVLAGTAALGFGFGLLGAPINSYPPMLFPAQPHASVVAAHTLIGLGLAAGPLVAGVFLAMGAWFAFPLVLAALAGGLAVATLATALPQAPASPGVAAAASDPPQAAPAFWIFFAITVLYAFAEGTFANWAVIYLAEARGLPEMTAGLALSTFWGALVIGRLLITALVTRVSPKLVWAGLPVLMIAAFLALPLADGAVLGIGVFALAGLSCSAFLPLTITLASHRFPDHVAWVSSMMIAALMVGVGVGSFAVGALREMLSFEDLYRLSTAYPAAVLVLTIFVFRARTPALAAGAR